MSFVAIGKASVGHSTAAIELRAGEVSNRFAPELKYHKDIVVITLASKRYLSAPKERLTTSTGRKKTTAKKSVEHEEYFIQRGEEKIEYVLSEAEMRVLYIALGICLKNKDSEIVDFECKNKE